MNPILEWIKLRKGIAIIFLLLAFAAGFFVLNYFYDYAFVPNIFKAAGTFTFENLIVRDSIENNLLNCSMGPPYAQPLTYRAEVWNRTGVRAYLHIGTNHGNTAGCDRVGGDSNPALIEKISGKESYEPGERGAIEFRIHLEAETCGRVQIDVAFFDAPRPADAANRVLIFGPRYNYTVNCGGGTPTPTPGGIGDFTLSGICAGGNIPKVNLNWTDASGAAEYNVQRKIKTDVDWTPIRRNLPPSTLSYTDENIALSTEYDYRIRARNDTTDRNSNIISVNTAQCGGTPTPTGTITSTPPPTLTLALSSCTGGTADPTVNLSWNAIAEAQGYVVSRRPPIGNDPIVTFPPTAATTYSDTTANGNFTYVYKVTAGLLPKGTVDSNNLLIKTDLATCGGGTPTPTPTGTVTPTPTIVTPTPTISFDIGIQKFGRNTTRNETTDQTQVSGQPGHTFQFTLKIRSLSDSAITNVIVRDVLPNGFSYVSGSTTLDGLAIADGVTSPGGVNIGVLTAFRERIIKLYVLAGPAAQFPEGASTHINRAYVRGDGIAERMAELPIIIAKGAITPPSEVPTGPVDSLILSLMISGFITLMYSLYTRTNIFRGREAKELLKEQAEDKDKFNFENKTT